MRVAIDARAAAEVPAGRGRYVRELLRGLARTDRDHEFLLYARERWHEAPADARFRWHVAKRPGLLWPLAAGREMSRAAEVALACTSYAMTGPWRIPGASIVWDFAPFERSLRAPRGSGFERATLRVALRRCEALIAISEATRRELGERFAGAEQKAVVAHPGADERFSPTPAAGDEEVLRRHGVRRPYVLSTGTLEPRKNLMRLLEAFAATERDQRGGWTLVLAGPRGWETDAVLDAARAEGNAVRTLGYVPDEELPALYRQADVFAYVSLYEGFGIPVLEAMSSGCAVLTSSTSSMPEVGGEAARYADPYDVQDIRRGLRELMQDADLRHSCAAAGLEQARRFSWDTTTRRIVDVLERLVPATRGAAASGK